MNTGNDSGVVPDNVMRQSYYLDPGASALIKISGLDVNLTYDFSFFASRDGGNDRTTNYTIDATTVSLDASFNTSEVVSIKDVISDANGEVFISIAPTANAIFGYLNGYWIEARDPGSPVTRLSTREEEPISSELEAGISVESI